MKQILLLALCAIFTLSCSKEELITEDTKEEKAVNELIFSIDDRQHLTLADGQVFENIYSAETDGLNFSFDIIDGNGAYKVEHQKDCKVTIEGNRVSVELLKSFSILTIVDKDEKKESVWVRSSSETFANHEYLFLDLSQKQVTHNHFKFGTGGYTAEKIHGSSAEITVINDILNIKALKGGTTYFYIVDKEGEKRFFDVSVGETYYINGTYIDIKAVHDQTINVMFKSSEKWRVADGEVEKHKDLLLHLVMHDATKYNKEHSSLQITITKDEKVALQRSIKVVNEKGNVAYINLSNKNY